MFTSRVRDAQAAGGIIGTLIGVVPAFILNKYFTTGQLLYLGIFLCLLGGLALKILQATFLSRPNLGKNHKLPLDNELGVVITLQQDGEKSKINCPKLR